LIGEVVKEINYPAEGEKPARIERTVTVADNVQRSQLIVQTTLKRAGQLCSKKYGDKVQTEISGPNGGAIQAAITVQFVRPKPSE
jgi:hypothetical protein